MEGYTESPAPVAGAVGVHVSVVDPGAVATEFVNDIGLDIESGIAAAGPYADAPRRYVDRTVGQFLDGAQSPAAGSRP